MLRVPVADAVRSIGVTEVMICVIGKLSAFSCSLMAPKSGAYASVPVFTVASVQKSEAHDDVATHARSDTGR